MIHIAGVGKSFHSDTQTVEALREVSFDVDAGEFVTIIGPSGSGKSTLFNILAGLVPADTGEVVYSWQDGGQHGGSNSPSQVQRGITTPADTSNVGYMPQRDLLLPWLRVIDNAALPLEIAGFSRAQAREQVRPHLAEFGLEEFAFARPVELSGGMRQRAALLRTVMTGRPVLLLDEPFGALDALTRRQMQTWLLGLHRRLHRTVLFITHDVDEAVYLADRVVVLTQRPATVLREIAVPLPRPRRLDMVEQPEFGHTVGALLKDLGL